MTATQVNADLSVPVLVHAETLPWVLSPSPGIDRRLLFRFGGERARATSVVRYAPASRFPRHVHPGGEEILVLSGVFQDEHGDFPAGSYLRNPPGSGHAPGATEGCTLFVKLWQFARDDRATVRRSAPTASEAAALFEGSHQTVRLERWGPGEAIDRPDADGLELLVLSGGCETGHGALDRLSWLRLPPGEAFRGRAGKAGCTVWMTAGWVPESALCPFDAAA